MRDDELSERAAKVAHVLHGKRPALDGERACLECRVVICDVCVENNDYDEELCEGCAYDAYQNRMYERERGDAEYEEYLEQKREAREENQREQWEREVAYERAIQRADSDAGTDVRQPDR